MRIRSTNRVRKEVREKSRALHRIGNSFGKERRILERPGDEVAGRRRVIVGQSPDDGFVHELASWRRSDRTRCLSAPWPDHPVARHALAGALVWRSQPNGERLPTPGRRVMNRESPMMHSPRAAIACVNGRRLT
jgi:hypothetical protein